MVKGHRSGIQGGLRESGDWFSQQFQEIDDFGLPTMESPNMEGIQGLWNKATITLTISNNQIHRLNPTIKLWR